MFGNPNLTNSLIVLSKVSLCVAILKLDMSRFISSTEFINFSNSTGVENLTELSVMGERDKNQLGQFCSNNKFNIILKTWYY